MKRCVHICRYSTDLIRMSALHQAVDKTSGAVVNFKANFFMNGPHCLAGNEAMRPVTSPQINTVSSWLLGICLLQMEAVDTLRLGIMLSKHGKEWEGKKYDNSMSCLSNMPKSLWSLMLIPGCSCLIATGQMRSGQRYRVVKNKTKKRTACFFVWLLLVMTTMI